MTVLASFALTQTVTLDRITARLVELTPEIAQARVDALWWNDNALNIPVTESDHHWPWENLATAYSKDPSRASVAVLSPEDYLEGAMTYRFDAKSRVEPGQGCVYIDRIAAAQPQTALPTSLLYGSWERLDAVRKSY